MRKGYWILDILFVVLLGILMSLNTKRITVLFIGNSYTYRNEMPDMFQDLARSLGKNVYVECCTQGKATLVIQSKRPELFEMIQSKKWDYIIIQASSRDLLRDSLTINKKTIPALKRIISAIDKNNPKTKKLFFMTWGYRNGNRPVKDGDSFSKMTRRVKSGYLALKEKFNIGVVPVGMAWYKVRKTHQEMVLYDRDGAHPNVKGSYLAACCFYSGIFNEKTVGSTFYSSLSPKTCRQIQIITSESVLTQRKRYGLVN